MKLTEFNNSRNSLESLLRRMLQYIEKNLQSFIAGQLLVEIAIGFLGFGKAAELLGLRSTAIL